MLVLSEKLNNITTSEGYPFNASQFHWFFYYFLTTNCRRGRTVACEYHHFSLETVWMDRGVAVIWSGDLLEPESKE